VPLELWEGDVSAGTWTRRTPIGQVPPPRVASQLVYDEVRGKVLLIGGFSDSNPRIAYDDVWEWDGAASSWMQLPVVVPRPSARYDHSVAYDSARGKVVLFGGSSFFTGGGTGGTGGMGGGTGGTGTGGMGTGGSWLNVQDVWELDSATGNWNARTMSDPAGPSVPAMLAYDASQQRVVCLDAYSETWLWDGDAGAWTQKNPAHKPSQRRDANLAYDKARAKVVLFGGTDGQLPQETWEWDGKDWRSLTTQGAKPPGRQGGGLAYDTQRGHLVLAGGLGPDAWDTWEFHGL
jgi:hypothetical protein